MILKKYLRIEDDVKASRKDIQQDAFHKNHHTFGSLISLFPIQYL